MVCCSVIRMDDFIRMWLEPGWDRQPSAQQPQWPAFIGLFFSERLMIRCSPSRWCTFVQDSFINPDLHTAKACSRIVGRHFLTAIAMRLQDESALVYHWTVFWKSICALVVYTCLLGPNELVCCVEWQMFYLDCLRTQTLNFIERILSDAYKGKSSLSENCSIVSDWRYSGKPRRGSAAFISL